jgi:hypothetical protein
VSVAPAARNGPDVWYWRIPLVGQPRDRGLDLDPAVPVLVGAWRDFLDAPECWLRHLRG